MAGWGSGAWAGSPWGSGFATGDLYVVNAYAVTTRAVRVQLSRPPRQLSTIGVGDALNPATWAVQALPSGPSFIVTSVVPVGADLMDVYTLQHFPGYPVVLRVSSATLVTPGGALIVDPKYGDFFGMEASPALRPARTQIEDLENPPFPLDTHPAGTLLTETSGDYRNHAGIPFLRKLVMRRLSTAPGEFFHLPDYGLGLRIKEPLKTQDLRKLQAEIRLMLLREPEFNDVRVRLELTSEGILYVQLSAILARDNTQVVIPIEVPTALVSL